MKKTFFRAGPKSGGFITSFITPVHVKRAPRFSLLDGVLMITMIGGLLWLMRFLLAR